MKKAVQYSDKFGQVVAEGEEPEVRPTPGVKVEQAEAKVEKTEAKAATKVAKTQAKAEAKVAKTGKKLPEGDDK